MPLASGQSLAIKAHVNNGETGLSNKKWSYRRERQRERKKGVRGGQNDKGEKGSRRGKFFSSSWEGFNSTVPASPDPPGVGPVPGHEGRREQR